MNIEIIEKIVEHATKKLDLKNLKLGDEYYYNSLPLCVIDAVYSIGVRYTSTQNTVERFCSYFNLQKYRENKIPDKLNQISTTELIDIYNKYDAQEMANNIYKNKQRTSPVNGILKSQAVLLYSQKLQQYGVEYFQDISKIENNEGFEKAVCLIPGQKSGISTKYFYMLAGSENFIKPDRMIVRFIKEATGIQNIKPAQCQSFLVEACKILSKEHSELTPRTLDHLIWKFQREA